MSTIVHKRKGVAVCVVDHCWQVVFAIVCAALYLLTSAVLGTQGGDAELGWKKGLARSAGGGGV